MNMCWVGKLTRNCSTSAYSKNRQKKRLTTDKLKLLRKKKFPTVRFVPSVAMRNRTRIYHLNEMDADHVTAWSKGGATSIDNCEMLCKTHNRSKGNR